MRKVIRHEVGDWAQSIDICSEIGPFILIRRAYKIKGEPYYDVDFYLDEFTEVGLKHVGDEDRVINARIGLLTDPLDILLCLASDIQEKQYKGAQQTELLKQDVEAIMRSRELLEGNKTCRR